VQFEIRITDGALRIECLITNSVVDEYEFCIVRAYEVVTAIVDVIAFTKGWALSVIFDHTIRDGIKKPMILSHGKVREYTSSIKNEKDFEDVLDIVQGNLNLRLAIHDLILALNTLNYPNVAAARSVEALRHIMAPPNTPESQAWEILRTNLRIERPYLQFITDNSRQARHGNRETAVGTVQAEATVRAWAIMNRFLEFMKRGGNNPLPEDEFRLLK